MYKSIFIILLCISSVLAARRHSHSYWEWGPRLNIVFVEENMGGFGGGIHFKNDFHHHFQFCPNLELTYVQDDHEYDEFYDEWYYHSIFEASMNWDLKFYPIRGDVCPYFGIGAAAPVMTYFRDTYNEIYDNDIDIGMNLLFGIDFNSFFLEIKNRFSW